MSTLELSAAIAAAVAELERDFGSVAVEPDGEGGAFVRVEDVDVGEGWVPRLVPIEFQVQYNYPFAAIYPYYTVPEIRRANGSGWPSGLQRVDWRGRQVAQISLRSPRWQPNIETAASNLAQVRHWFHTTT
jgi:hypothetical protein